MAGDTEAATQTNGRAPAQPAGTEAGETEAATQKNGRVPAQPAQPAAKTDDPAFYIRGRGRWRDIRAILHPPYTAWHLSYVVLGAVSGARFSWSVLGATLAAFFLAVGVAAHALDELRDRPLRTELSTASLVTASVVGVAGAVALGIVGTVRVGPWLLVFIAVGTALVVLYSLELLGGLIHNDLGFALAWGGFPVLTAAFAENRSVPVAAVLLAVAATLLSAAQRALSTPARALRRRTTFVEGRVVRADGEEEALDRAVILAPLERALRCLAWGTVALAAGLLVARGLHWTW